MTVINFIIKWRCVRLDSSKHLLELGSIVIESFLSDGVVIRAGCPCGHELNGVRAGSLADVGCGGLVHVRTGLVDAIG